MNIYNIFGICYGPEPHPQLQSGNEASYKRHYTPADYTPFLKRFRSETHGRKLDQSSLPPCTFGTPIADYFNRIDVRTNLNIPTTVQAWELCTDEIVYNETATGS